MISHFQWYIPGPMPSEGSYVRLISWKLTLSDQVLACSLPDAKLQLQMENDSCEQKVNQHMLAKSAAYFGAKMVINA